MGLHDTDYGSRDFAVRDPEGDRWSIGTYRGSPGRTRPRARRLERAREPAGLNAPESPPA